MKKGENIEVFVTDRKGEIKNRPWSDDHLIYRPHLTKIKRLAHTTHSRHMRMICTPGLMRFKFHKIFGKPKTYTQVCKDFFKKVERKENLLPGYYLWLETDFTEEDRKILNREVTDAWEDTSLTRRTLDLPDYLRGSGSHGPCKCSLDLTTVLKRYKNMREEAQGRELDLVLRYAGDNHYKYRTDSVVIVCCKQDRELSRYKTLGTDEETKELGFDISRVVNENDHVDLNSTEARIDFKSQCISTKRHKDCCRSFWHEAVFVLYSPTQELVLTIPEESDTRFQPVRHHLCSKFGRQCNNQSMNT